MPQLVTCEGEAGPLWPNHHLMLGAGGKRGQGGWTPCSRRIQVGGSLGTTHTISHHHPGVFPRGKAEEALGGQRLKEQTRAAPQVGTQCVPGPRRGAGSQVSRILGITEGSTAPGVQGAAALPALPEPALCTSPGGVLCSRASNGFSIHKAVGECIGRGCS